jgi:hypothetical protein
MITHSVRTVIIGKLFEKAGIKPVDSSIQKNKRFRIKRDQEDLNKIKQGILDTLNPFESKFADNDLYYFSTGKVVFKEIATALISI